MRPQNHPIIMHATYITQAGGLVANRKHFWIHSNVRRGEAHTNHASKIFTQANHQTRTPGIAYFSQIKNLSFRLIPQEILT